jgi:hypothetical protein
VAGVEAHDRKAELAQLQGQPVRHLPGLQANARCGGGVYAHCLADCLWLGAAFAPPNDRAGLIDDADRGGLKRDIKAGIVLLVHGNASGEWLPAEATWTFSPAPLPRLRHVPTCHSAGSRAQAGSNSPRLRAGTGATRSRPSSGRRAWRGPTIWRRRARRHAGGK